VVQYVEQCRQVMFVLLAAGASENMDIFAAAAALAEDKALAADVLSVEFVPQVSTQHCWGHAVTVFCTSSAW